MKRAVFEGVDPAGRGISLQYRLEPAYKGAANALWSRLPDGHTVVLAVAPDGGPMPELSDGSEGILFRSDAGDNPGLAFGSFGYTDEGTPGFVRRRVTVTAETKGTTADSRDAIVTRLVKGYEKTSVSIEILE